MDDFRLRVFITAAKTLNFTKCAEQLFISQPAVSKHIGELESRYKVQLFERSGSRLALTEAGRVMLEHAERIADGYRRLQYEMDLFTDRLGGELKVGASTTIAQYVLPQVLARFTARFPEVKVSLASGKQRAGRGGPRASRYRFGVGRKQRPASGVPLRTVHSRRTGADRFYER